MKTQGRSASLLDVTGQESLTSQTGDNEIRCVRIGMARRSYPDSGYTVQQGAPIHFYGRSRSKLSLFLVFQQLDERSARKYIALVIG